MKKITLGALALLTIATACRDDSYSLPAKSSTNLVTPTLHTRVNGSQSPLTGILEAYPCLEGSSIYFGNYVNNTLSVFYGFYNVLDGNITGDYNREVSLPVGTYNIVYWGTPKYEEPIHTTPAIVEPGLTRSRSFAVVFQPTKEQSGYNVHSCIRHGTCKQGSNHRTGRSGGKHESCSSRTEGDRQD